MKIEELIEELKKLQDRSDHEIAHSDADGLLLQYIDNKEVTEAFEAIEKWYA